MEAATLAIVTGILIAATPALPAMGPQATQDYAAEIEAEREAAEDRFRNDHWSPLALIALVRLEGEPLTIGSAPDADLRLTGPGVAAEHAIVRPKPGDHGSEYVLTPVSGELDDEAGNRLGRLDLVKGGVRVQVGRFLVYYDEISTLGPVMRVLDFESPAYTLFDGLDYFPIDPAYRVEATVVPYPTPEPTKIIDTMGFLTDAWIYGEAKFRLQEHDLSLKLVLFAPNPTPDTSFYLIFGDTTNGVETYGAARYLLPQFVAEGHMVLDFNRSVNPSCAYNAGFACPLPPPGNRLPFDIRAGIKDYAHRPAR